MPDGQGVSLNQFETRAERDEEVRELLSHDYSEGDPAPFAASATAEEAWDAICAQSDPDFFLAFSEMTTDKTTALLCEVLTVLCDSRAGYRDRDMHRHPEALIAAAREHLASKGIDGDGAWGGSQAE